jgi:hypothetical protein
MPLGEQMTFTVNVFPSGGTFAWFMDGAPLSNTGNSYTYTALTGGHFLIVRATHIFGTDTQAWYIYGNSPPVAKAGNDQIVAINATVTLDGSGSSDLENNIVSYQWEQIGGPTVTLTNADTAIAKFTASITVGSLLTFELTVTDSCGLTSKDACVLFVGLFNRTYGGISPDYAFAVQKTNDGGYILAGSTNSFGAGNGDAWLIKTDANGNKVWDKTFGGSYSDGAYAVQQTSDGGYILAGSTQSYGAGSSDAWLIKTDADGNKLWDKTFGGINSDGASAVQQTSDGGYILAGSTNSFGADNYDAWLIKTDANGNKVWDRTFGGSGMDGAYAVQQTSDGGYILAGFTDSYGAGSRDGWLIKTDANGNKLWDKTFGGSANDLAYALQQTSDSGYILAGWTYSYGAVNSDAWLIKTDVNGNKVWEKTFGGSSDDSAYTVRQTSDGGYILAGGTASYGAGNGGAWLIKTDAKGNEVWDKTFGGGFFALSVQQMSDGGYILAGITGSYGSGDVDAWLAKTDADGNAPSTQTR